MMRGYMEGVEGRDDPGAPKSGDVADPALEGDLTGGGLLPPDILGIDVAEIDPDAGTPASLDIAGIDDGSIGWGGAEPTLPPD